MDGVCDPIDAWGDNARNFRPPCKPTTYKWTYNGLAPSQARRNGFKSWWDIPIIWWVKSAPTVGIGLR